MSEAPTITKQSRKVASMDEVRPAVGRVQLSNVSKRYPGTADAPPAVDGFSLDIQPGEFVSLLGPSGCGKTTTLRMIAGFETLSDGQITLDGADLGSLPPNRRPMSMVFQSYALFPHLSVRDNIAYGLKLKKLSKAEINREVDSVVETMGLLSLDRRAPHQLSGGQQQRVALARALVMRPKVLLFDEPLSNLDAKLRGQMRLQIRKLQQQLGITSIFVTHDQEEAMTMSDRIVVMSGGKVHQVDSPENVYRRPETRFVADFIGTANFIDVHVHDVVDGRADVRVLGMAHSVASHPAVSDTSPSVLLARPEGISLRPAPVGATIGADVGKVISASFVGNRIDYEVETEAGILLVSDSADHRGANADDLVQVVVDADRAWLLPDEAA